MQFSGKDLLITVLPKAELEDPALAKICLLRTCVCRYPTYQCLNTCLFHSCGYCSIVGTCGYCSRFPTVCGVCSFHGTFGCGFLNSCGAGFSACDYTAICPGASREPWVIQHEEDLASLRTELQDTLRKLDEIHKEGLPSRISSKAEADALEAGLSEALEQVRAAKKGLK